MEHLCCRIHPNNRRIVWIPLSMTGEELCSTIREHLLDMYNHLEGLHPSLKSWYDKVLDLSDREFFNHQILSETNIDDGNCRLPRPIIEWLGKHLETLKAVPDRPRNTWIGRTDSEILNDLWEVLDTVIFNGALHRACCTLNFVRQGTPKWKENNNGKKAMGISLDRRCYGVRPDTVHSDIEIFEIPVGGGEEYYPETHLRGYIGTLLHEMVHSLISIYVCDCERCHAEPTNPDGETGHGKGWAELAHGIELFAKKMMNIDLDLGVIEAVAEELVATGEPADEWPLEELGICPNELEGHKHRIFLAKYCNKTLTKGGKKSIDLVPWIPRFQS